MNSNLERRLALLKARIGGEAIVLHMADGSVRQIRGTAKHYLELAALLDCDGESPLHRELAWIRDAVTISEEAHVYELLQALLRGPVEDVESNVIVMASSNDEDGEEDGPH